MPEFPAEFLLAALVVTTLASGGLLGLWAATSRWHWFARTMVVLGLLMPLLWRPIFEPFVTLLAEVVTIVVGVMIYRRNWPRWRFSIADGLMGMVVVSVLAAGWVSGWSRSYGTETSWFELVQVAGLGLLAGISLLLGAWLVVRPWRWKWKFLTIVPFVLVLSVGEPFVNYLANWYYFDGGVVYMTWSKPEGVPPGMIVVIPQILVGVLVAMLDRRIVEDTTNVWRGVAVASTLLIAAYPLSMAWRLSTPVAVPHDTGESSPAYKALEAMTAQPNLANILNFGGATPVNLIGLGQAVDAAKGDFEQLDRLLEDPLVMAVRYDEFAVEPLTPRRDLMLLLGARSAVARHRGRSHEFFDACKSQFKFIAALEGQGMIVDSLTHKALESTALEEIYLGRGLLDSTQSRELSLLLANYNANRHPLSETLHRERIYLENANGWIGHLIEFLEIRPVALAGMQVPPHDWMRKMSEAEAALLATELAIRAYRRDRYGLPQQLADLVPKYLPEVPLDPWSTSGEPLRYHRDGQNYSVLILGEGEPLTLKDAFE